MELSDLEKKQFNEAIQRLKLSPIYAMSLGSKELFHSNFWAWIIEQEETRSFIHCFFPNFNLDNFKSVEREDNYRDLVIHDINGNEYVIENKIKSYPDYEQLKKYKISQGVVTGINKPPFVLPDGWESITYNDICDFLVKMPFVKNEFNREIINAYIQMLSDINIVLKLSFKDRDGYLSYWSDQINELNNKNIRLLDVFRKNKADDFVSKCLNLKSTFKEEKDTQFDSKKWYFWIERSFHNCKATINFVFRKYDDGPEEWKYNREIGVQIEDNQFRLFLGSKHMNLNQLFELGVEIGWFEDGFNKKTNRKIRNYESSMSKNPCKYGDHWVYQYFDAWVENKQNLQDYACIEKMLIKELKFAQQLIVDNKF